jgi:hypothetical protein
MIKGYWDGKYWYLCLAWFSSCRSQFLLDWWIFGRDKRNSRTTSPIANAFFPKSGEVGWNDRYGPNFSWADPFDLSVGNARHSGRSLLFAYLDSPTLRKRKLQIFVDDDGLPGGDTHHYQLTRAFRNIGAKLALDDEEFGDVEGLCQHLTGQTAQFVRLTKQLYSRSLGPWCAVEVMSVDWMKALAESLSVHFPKIVDEPYFADCFSQHVEERHADESLEITQMVLKARPTLLHETINDAKIMAAALDGVWSDLDRIVQNATQKVRHS